jgi:DMSO reductase anchor subunit
MDLLQPSSGLLIWTILSIISFILFVAALISLLRNEQMHRTTKLMWAIIIIFVPLIGSILFFTLGKSEKNISNPSQS